MNVQKELSLNQIEGMVHDKKDILSKQIVETEYYLKEINDAKAKYEEYLNKSNMDLKQRRKAILAMTRRVLRRDDISIAMKTAPNIEFNVAKHKKQFDEICNDLKVNDCDHPRSMQLELYNVRDQMVEVEYALHSDDIVGSK